MFGHTSDRTGAVFVTLSLLVLRRTAFAQGYPTHPIQKVIISRQLAGVRYISFDVFSLVIATNKSC